ncbi:hypothetical protein [Halomonas sp. E19]|uniref:hypothetical protein n=1 Tax=Halomonas sp. E19 TaxID=3397247 RepID=UPI0040341C31
MTTPAGRQVATARQAVRQLILASLSATLAVPAAQAQPSGQASPSIWPPVLEVEHVLLQTSLYTRHFNPQPDHNNTQELISLELHNPQRWLVGGARFLNSFDQETVYLYAGREFPSGSLVTTSPCAPSSPPACCTATAASTRTIFRLTATALPRRPCPAWVCSGGASRPT